VRQTLATRSQKCFSYFDFQNQACVREIRRAIPPFPRSLQKGWDRTNSLPRLLPGAEQPKAAGPTAGGLPGMKNKKRRCYEAHASGGVIPVQMLAKVEERKNCKNG
jgi:hypothetical protein